MTRSAWLLPLLVACIPAVAGSAAAQQLTDASAGEQIFRQHCSVCHIQPSIVNNRFGPALWQETVDGKEAAVREFVAKGTPRMPGFQYTLQPHDVDLVIAYLKTVPKPADKPVTAARGNAREDD